MAKTQSIQEMAALMRQSIQSLNEKISQKSSERARILGAPRELDSVMREIFADVDRRADEFSKLICSQFSTAKSPRSSGADRTIYVHGNAGPDTSSGAFYWLHRDEIKKRIADTVKDDPLVSGSEVGLSDEDRNQKLRVIDAELEALEAEKQQIVSELAAAGVQVFI